MKQNKKLIPLFGKILPNKCEYPYHISAVYAGFPSPAQDYEEQSLDLNELLIQHPSATFFMRVEGDSMIEAGIKSGDILIVDRSVEPTQGKVVIASVNGELIVKKIEKHNDKWFLVGANKNFKPVEVNEEMDISIWGVVTYIIHNAK